LVAYAAAAGTTADDGTGRNSPYTSALLSYLEQPLEIGLLFREVRARVLEATAGRQRPHEYASLLGEHYLRAAAGSDPRAVEAALGLDRPARRLVQQGLARAGYSPGPADGVFGPATRAAIRGWQTSRGATATGYLDAVGAASLGAPVPAAALAPVAAAAPANVSAPSDAVSAPATGNTTAELTRAETVFWESMRDSTSASDFEAYLARWPSGIYAPLATNRLTALREAASDPPVVDPPRTREPGDVFRDCPTCPEMAVIPAGTFLMGSDRRDDESYDNERPRHRVTVDGFALGVHEVTRDEYAAFVAATGRGSGDRCWALDADEGRWDWRSEASWRSPGYPQAGDHPVVCVNWEDAQAYVGWLSEETGEAYRLPSEAEWEYAARSGTTTRRHWGDDADDGCAYANGADRTAKRRFDNWTVADCTDGVVWTSPVGAYQPNAFGLHDALGNVWEWVEDCWHDDYDGAPRDGSAWTRGGDCGRRVLRGGSWVSYPRFLRSALRRRSDAENRSTTHGFRVARTLD
ncbi:MAG: SUMF1/EgtB/PvdO family nonheme iron enzyme, partial [Acidobacteria bacterium]|nr:SUMF1/EgtB/PvdO family nonheme iron enzyme [Acidobacteriota bacterium]